MKKSLQCGLMVALALTLTLVLFACAVDPAPSADPTAVQSSAKPNYVELTIDTETIRLEMGGTAWIELNTLNCERDLPVTLTAHGSYAVTFAGVPLTSGEPISYRLNRLDPNDVIPVAVTDLDNGTVQSFSIATWPSFIPIYTVVGQSPYAGDYYLTTMSAQGNDNIAMKVGTDGLLKYYKFNPYGCFADFKKVTTPDGVRYLLFTTVSSPYFTRGISQSGCYLVMDENYHEINRLFMHKSGRVPAEGYPVDQHDCLYIDDSEYYLISYVDKNVYNIPDSVEHKEYGTLVSEAVIQGIRDGEVFFEWGSTEYPELYALSREFNDFTNSKGVYSADYMHINSIALDPDDGNLIASFRNIDAVIKINLDSGGMLWKLSGMGDDFGLTEEQKTSRQHYANYTSLGSITVFDNGVESGQTRVVEYWLDEENLELKDFRSYQINGYYSYATGSVQRIDEENDVYMIGWGTRILGEDGAYSLYPQFSEIDFTKGETLFEFRFTNTGMNTYRCVKCP